MSAHIPPLFENKYRSTKTVGFSLLSSQGASSYQGKAYVGAHITKLIRGQGSSRNELTLMQFHWLKKTGKERSGSWTAGNFESDQGP